MIQKKEEEDRNGIYNLELEATGMNHLIVLSEGNDAVCCFMPLGEFFSHHIRVLSVLTFRIRFFTLKITKQSD